MKISFISNTLGPGGAERTVSYLSNYFIEQGQEVSLLLNVNEIFYSLNPKLKTIVLNLPSTPSKFIVVRAAVKTIRMILQRRMIKRIKPDVIIAIPASNADLICSCKRRLGFKLFVSERSNPVYVDDNTMKKNIKVFKYADGIIFQTEQAKSFYENRINLDKSCVISNAIGNPLVYNIRNTGIKEKKIVAIGRLDPAKDYSTLLKSFRIVHESHPDYWLEIYGDGPDRERLEKSAKQLGIDETVVFMGNREDAISLAASASCYVLSSKHEGMPNSLMEAMAVGLPCVSTACPNGPEEIISNGVNGLLVPVGDEEEMAKAIIRMIEDNEFSDSCGNEARKILQTHSIDIKAKEYLDFIGG